MTYQFSDPAFKVISKLNGQVNQMSQEELETNLKKYQLNSRGNKEILKRRLKQYYKKAELKEEECPKKKLTPYFIIIDFEATCDESNLNYQHEIIEFPAILVDSHSNTVIDEFHSYVKPVLNPILTDFCTRLTGIKQETVDKSPTFPIVFKLWQEWLLQKGLSSHKFFTIVTDGPWDMEKFLWQQCCISRVSMPKYCQRWINIRKLFSAAYRSQRSNIAVMLDAFSMQFEGTPHSGLDDARNITRILIVMLEDGIIPQINEHLKASHKNLIERITDGFKPTEVMTTLENAKNVVERLKDANDNQKSADPEDDLSDLMRYISLQKS